MTEHLDSIKSRARSKLERDMGEHLLCALHDPRTVELMVNADGKVWQERLGESMSCIGRLRPAQARGIIETCAGYHQKEVTKSKPIFEGEFPLDGSRFAGQLPPIVPNPTFAIRKRAIAVYGLETYVEREIMTEGQRVLLVEGIKGKKNILVTGGTGSGKTTLVNAIINQMVVLNPDERIFILEDTGEVQCEADNHVSYHTTLEVSMTDLIKTSLRMRPDRILVGEVRGPEALDLLDSWNTGHEGGVATLHANNATAGLTRLRSLISRNISAPKEIEPLIAEAVDLVVHIARTSTGRKVTEIIAIEAFSNGNYSISYLA